MEYLACRFSPRQQGKRGYSKKWSIYPLDSPINGVSNRVISPYEIEKCRILKEKGILQKMEAVYTYPRIERSNRLDMVQRDRKVCLKFLMAATLI